MGSHIVYIFWLGAGIILHPAAAKSIFKKYWVWEFLQVKVEMEKNCVDIGDLNNTVWVCTRFLYNYRTAVQSHFSYVMSLQLQAVSPF